MAEQWRVERWGNGFVLYEGELIDCVRAAGAHNNEGPFRFVKLKECGCPVTCTKKCDMCHGKN